MVQQLYTQSDDISIVLISNETSILIALLIIIDLKQRLGILVLLFYHIFLYNYKSITYIQHIMML